MKRRVRDLKDLDVIEGQYTITRDLKVKLEDSQVIRFTGNKLKWSQIPVQFAPPDWDIRLDLSVSFLPIKTLVGSPSTVQMMEIRDLPSLTSLEGGPIACRDMTLVNLPSIRSLRGAPQSAMTVGIINTGITSLEGLPQNTKYLDLSGNRELRSLRGCPDELYRLYITGSPITSLEGSPIAVQSFHIDGTRLTSLVGGPVAFSRRYDCLDPLETFDGSPVVTAGGSSHPVFHAIVSPKTKSFRKLPSHPSLELSLVFRDFPSSSMTNVSFFEHLLRFREEGTWDASVPMDDFTKLWSTFPFDIELDRLVLSGISNHGRFAGPRNRMVSGLDNVQRKRVFPNIQEIEIRRDF